MESQSRNKIVIYMSDSNRQGIETLEHEIEQERGFKVSRSQIVREILVKYLMERNSK